MDLLELFAAPKAHHDENILIEVGIFIAELVKKRLQSFVTGKHPWSNCQLNHLLDVLTRKIG